MKRLQKLAGIIKEENTPINKVSDLRTMFKEFSLASLPGISSKEVGLLKTFITDLLNKAQKGSIESYLTSASEYWNTRTSGIKTGTSSTETGTSKDNS